MMQNVLESWRVDREAHTTHQRHGDGLLTFFDGKPVCASGCLLPDGCAVEAVCLARNEDAEVWSRSIDGTRLCRRGRLIVKPGIALHFVDEPQADMPRNAHTAVVLARDLARSGRIRELVQSDLFAGLLYAALCNVEWRRRDSNESWHCSWRMAGELVAGLRGEGDCLSWYCWGHEGTIDEVVLNELAALGWTPVSLEASP